MELGTSTIGKDQKRKREPRIVKKPENADETRQISNIELEENSSMTECGCARRHAPIRSENRIKAKKARGENMVQYTPKCPNM